MPKKGLTLTVPEIISAFFNRFTEHCSFLPENYIKQQMKTEHSQLSFAPENPFIVDLLQDKIMIIF